MKNIRKSKPSRVQWAARPHSGSSSCGPQTFRALLSGSPQIWEAEATSPTLQVQRQAWGNLSQLSPASRQRERRNQGRLIPG